MCAGCVRETRRMRERGGKANDGGVWNGWVYGRSTDIVFNSALWWSRYPVDTDFVATDQFNKVMQLGGRATWSTGTSYPGRTGLDEEMNSPGYGQNGDQCRDIYVGYVQGTAPVSQCHTDMGKQFSNFSQIRRSPPRAHGRLVLSARHARCLPTSCCGCLLRTRHVATLSARAMPLDVRPATVCWLNLCNHMWLGTATEGPPATPSSEGPKPSDPYGPQPVPVMTTEEIALMNQKIRQHDIMASYGLGGNSPVKVRATGHRHAVSHLLSAQLELALQFEVSTNMAHPLARRAPSDTR